MAGKSNMSFFIIIVVILLVDAVGGYIIGKKVLVPYSYEREMIAGESESSTPEEGEVSSEEFGFPHPLDAINLNPANSAGEVFSCTMTLAASNQEVITELTDRNPQIVDIIITYLSSKTIPELSDVTQRIEYRKEIVQKINSVLTNGEIINLYITQWIIQ